MTCQFYAAMSICSGIFLFLLFVVGMKIHHIRKKCDQKQNKNVSVFKDIVLSIVIIFLAICFVLLQVFSPAFKLFTPGTPVIKIIHIFCGFISIMTIICSTATIACSVYPSKLFNSNHIYFANISFLVLFCFISFVKYLFCVYLNFYPLTSLNPILQFKKLGALLDNTNNVSEIVILPFLSEISTTSWWNCEPEQWPAKIIITGNEIRLEPHHKDSSEVKVKDLKQLGSNDGRTQMSFIECDDEQWNDNWWQKFLHYTNIRKESTFIIISHHHRLLGKNKSLLQYTGTMDKPGIRNCECFKVTISFSDKMINKSDVIFQRIADGTHNDKFETGKYKAIENAKNLLLNTNNLLNPNGHKPYTVVVYLVRHGESLHNLKQKFGFLRRNNKHLDSCLTEQGVINCIDTAKKINEDLTINGVEKQDLMYCSSYLSRAHFTALCIKWFIDLKDGTVAETNPHDIVLYYYLTLLRNSNSIINTDFKDKLNNLKTHFLCHIDL